MHLASLVARATYALALSQLASSSLATAQIWEICTLRDTYVGEAPGDQFGWVGVNAGDVDADGVDDIIFGAPFHDTGGTSAGRVTVNSGATGALLFTVDGTAGQQLGFAVSAAGDVNGDGFGDVIAGAPFGGQGQALVLLGPAGSRHLTLSGVQANDNFGYSVSTGFDVDGDGLDDVIVGATGDDTFGQNAGRVAVFRGTDGMELHFHLGEGAGAQAGSAVGPIGDPDGDGFGDYVFGAMGAAGGVGRAYVHRGVDGSLRCTIDTDATGANFGQFFCGWVGDVNADGGPDFFVSDFGNGALGPATGRAFVYSGLDCSVLHVLTGTGPNQGFGIGRGWAGDVDRDGHDDLFFGSWLADEGGGNAGKGTLLSGATGERMAAWTGTEPGASLGFDAAGMGDVDGDGWNDFLLTAATSNAATGAAYVVRGGPDNPIVTCAAEQNSLGLEARLEHRRSTSLAANEFRLRVEDAIPGETAVFFYGPKREEKPLGDGTLCVSGAQYRLATVKLNNQGSKFIDVDFTTGAPSNGPGEITAGSSWYFQAWYRDPGGAAGSNLSNGLRVTFCQ